MSPPSTWVVDRMRGGLFNLPVHGISTSSGWNNPFQLDQFLLGEFSMFNFSSACIVSWKVFPQKSYPLGAWEHDLMSSFPRDLKTGIKLYKASSTCSFPLSSPKTQDADPRREVRTYVSDASFLFLCFFILHPRDWTAPDSTTSHVYHSLGLWRRLTFKSPSFRCIKRSLET